MSLIETSLNDLELALLLDFFCWSEVGAEFVGIVQSLLVTVKLHGIDPYKYLVDVLHRVSTHPAKAVDLLTPRLWKEKLP